MVLLKYNDTRCFQNPSKIHEKNHFSSICLPSFSFDDNMLVGGFNQFLFSIIYGIILPIDFHIVQRGRSTTNQPSLSND